MKFAIISDIHVGEEGEHKGVMRKLSRYSMQFLKDFIARMNVDIKPEFVVNLGDAISGKSAETNVQNLHTVLEALKQIESPVFNLVGNHEQWANTREELELALGLDSLYFSIDLGEYHLLFLLSESFQGADAEVGVEQKKWLKTDLEKSDKRTLVFIHHPLADQSQVGNFWFEGRENRALVGNRHEIRDIFETSGSVVAVFNGHTHWNKMDVHNGIPYFNITSIVENFRNDGTPSASYAIVDVDENEIHVDIVGEDRAHYTYAFT